MALSLATGDMACRPPPASDAFAIPHAETLVSSESANASFILIVHENAARLCEGHTACEGDGRRGYRRARDERCAAHARTRFSLATDRAGLLRHELGEVALGNLAARRAPPIAFHNPALQRLAIRRSRACLGDCRQFTLAGAGRRGKPAARRGRDIRARLGSHGVQAVELSVDGGASWFAAELEPRTGGYSWQTFRARWSPPAAGHYEIAVRARDVQGCVQPESLHINQIQRVAFFVG